MQLSRNFTLQEMTKSQVAARNNIKNNPGEREIWNLKELVVNVLQPIRDYFGQVIVTSGYRCLPLNRKVGSSDTSQHVVGRAADIEVIDVSNYDLASWIEDNLVYDQLILEMFDPDEGPNSGWVHVSYVSNRKESLTYYSKGYYRDGLRKN